MTLSEGAHGLAKAMLF